MITQINQQQKTSFKSIKPTIRAGEDVLREFKSEFPTLKSPSLISVRISGIVAENRNSDLYNRLRILNNTFEQKLNGCRCYINRLTYKNCINSTIKQVKKSNLANCGEISKIVQDKLLSKGIKADRIGVQVQSCKDYYQPRGLKHHSFVVINLAEDAVLDRPQYWGRKAVIVDAWLGICGPAKEILNSYKSLFKLNDEKEWFEFLDVNIYDIDKILRKKQKANN